MYPWLFETTHPQAAIVNGFCDNKKATGSNLVIVQCLDCFLGVLMFRHEIYWNKISKIHFHKLTLKHNLCHEQHLCVGKPNVAITPVRTRVFHHEPMFVNRTFDRSSLLGRLWRCFFAETALTDPAENGNQFIFKTVSWNSSHINLAAPAIVES